MDVPGVGVSPVVSSLYPLLSFKKGFIIFQDMIVTTPTVYRFARKPHSMLMKEAILSFGII